MSNIFKNCPECNKEIIYSSIYSLKTSIKNNSKCKSCAMSGENNSMYGRTGDKNGFYGKKHTKETKNKLSSLQKNIYKNRSEDEKEKILKILLEGRTGPRKSNYEYWVDKYGVEEADKRNNDFKNKLSKLFSGSGNPMYGRPTPNKAGYGVSGWYKEEFFRSLRELSFLLDNIEAVSAESNKWRTTYKNYNNVEKTTIPDFVIESTKTVYECKPDRLHNTYLVQLKANALKKHCNSLGYDYVLIDPGLPDFNLVDRLIEEDAVKLTEEGLKRYKKWRNP